MKFSTSFRIIGALPVGMWSLSLSDVQHPRVLFIGGDAKGKRGGLYIYDSWSGEGREVEAKGLLPASPYRAAATSFYDASGAEKIALVVWGKETGGGDFSLHAYVMNEEGGELTEEEIPNDILNDTSDDSNAPKPRPHKAKGQGKPKPTHTASTRAAKRPPVLTLIRYPRQKEGGDEEGGDDLLLLFFNPLAEGTERMKLWVREGGTTQGQWRRLPIPCIEGLAASDETEAEKEAALSFTADYDPGEKIRVPLSQIRSATLILFDEARGESCVRGDDGEYSGVQETSPRYRPLIVIAAQGREEEKLATDRICLLPIYRRGESDLEEWAIGGEESVCDDGRGRMRRTHLLASPAPHTSFIALGGSLMLQPFYAYFVPFKAVTATGEADVLARRRFTTSRPAKWNYTRAMDETRTLAPHASPFFFDYEIASGSQPQVAVTIRWPLHSGGTRESRRTLPLPASFATPPDPSSTSARLHFVCIPDEVSAAPSESTPLKGELIVWQHGATDFVVLPL